MRRYMHRTLSRRDKLLLWLAALLIAMVSLAAVAASHLKPILTSLATARVANTVTRIVTEAVNETVYEGGTDYDSLVRLEKDNEGRIVALKSDMAAFNRLQSEVLASVLERMSEVDTRELSIPIGTLTGSPLLAGRGPAIRVMMQSVGSPSAHFENAFTSAGINQTKHQILLVVDVSVGILLPGYSTGTRVSGSFSVAETVIVGMVPENYTYFNSNDIADAAQEYVMNKG
ncbi:MAG: sporulation protein YunB [Oscillospiraceae bacterium]|nr:sporulation protein YunB [Oscillospiraceae bacterium]